MTALPGSPPLTVPNFHCGSNVELVLLLLRDPSSRISVSSAMLLASQPTFATGVGCERCFGGVGGLSGAWTRGSPGAAKVSPGGGDSTSNPVTAVEGLAAATASGGLRL